MSEDRDSKIRAYYAESEEREWLRLADGEGLVEFAITTHALAEHLPKSGRVLDIGGGPGRYAIWLAQRGYQVVLADLSPNLLDIARAEISKAGLEARIEAFVEADARDLNRWPDDAFDAVLSLGPFYHLPELDDRHAAAREMARVLRPSGLAFVAFMPRYTFLRRTLAIADERQHLESPDWVTQLMSDGRFDNDRPGRFNAGYGAHPTEIEPFLTGHGFKSVALLATESVASGLGEQISELANTSPHTYRAALDLMIQAASDRSIHGTSGHLLYVGRKVAS